MSFGIPAALLFGLVLIIASLFLFLTSKFKPNLYEESDNIYVGIGIVCGLLLLISLDLGAAMAFQQMLMIGMMVTMMWRLINIRAENKLLKSRKQGVESPNASYNARLEDDRYLDSPKEQRQTKRRKNRAYYDEDRRLLQDGDELEMPMLSRSQPRSFNRQSDVVAGDNRQRRRSATLSSRSQAWSDDGDWNEESSERKPRRALPDGDRPSPPPTDRRFESEIDSQDRESSPRRRRAPSQRTESAEGSTSGYVDYEPLDGRQESLGTGSDPIEFPDRY